MNNDIMGPNPSYTTPIAQRPAPQAPATEPPAPDPVYQAAAPRAGKGGKILKLLLVIVLIAAAGGGAYYWQNEQVKDLNAKVSDLQNTNNSLSGQVGSLNQQLSQNQTPQTTNYSATLPNGKKISYPLNTTNATILWWYGGFSGSKQPNGKFLYLSSTKLAQYLSGIPSTDVNKICTQNGVSGAFDSGAIEMADIDTTAKTPKLDYNKGFPNCVEQLAKNKKYSTDATKLINETKTDLDSFVKSLQIQ